MAKEKKMRKQLTLSETAYKCVVEHGGNTNRSFNNFIETLILQHCNKAKL